MLTIFLKGRRWAKLNLDLIAYLSAENLVLRQQLLILKRGQKRPQIKNRDRLFWVATRLRHAIRSSGIDTQSVEHKV